ncbi:unnamed protein product [Protopolystoma xenopodis]|uniref:TRAF3-interacting protein 1 C-terminal domain-containing protein n=1 Tax=Protopolystoma xenopodis TaxID=117903 RepID=A0A3S5BP51_9PLAT|nr:unnamed protein product [Protopolystoma xenopodis]
MPCKQRRHECSRKANRQMVKKNPSSSSGGIDFRISSPNIFTRNGSRFNRKNMLIIEDVKTKMLWPLVCLTETSLEPLQVQLREVEQSVARNKQAILDVKSRICQNDERIQRLLSKASGLTY